MFLFLNCSFIWHSSLATNKQKKITGKSKFQNQKIHSNHSELISTCFLSSSWRKDNIIWYNYRKREDFFFFLSSMKNEKKKTVFFHNRKKKKIQIRTPFHFIPFHYIHFIQIKDQIREIFSLLLFLLLLSSLSSLFFLFFLFSLFSLFCLNPCCCYCYCCYCYCCWGDARCYCFLGQVSRVACWREGSHCLCCDYCWYYWRCCFERNS